eukprot:1035463-Prorocentrum_minimum.AAC.5
MNEGGMLAGHHLRKRIAEETKGAHGDGGQHGHHIACFERGIPPLEHCTATYKASSALLASNLDQQGKARRPSVADSGEQPNEGFRSTEHSPKCVYIPKSNATM